jgi:hypothetical protein
MNTIQYLLSLECGQALSETKIQLAVSKESTSMETHLYEKNLFIISDCCSKNGFDSDNIPKFWGFVWVQNERFIDHAINFSNEYISEPPDGPPPKELCLETNGTFSEINGIKNVEKEQFCNDFIINFNSSIYTFKFVKTFPAKHDNPISVTFRHHHPSDEITLE